MSGDTVTFGNSFSWEDYKPAIIVGSLFFLVIGLTVTFVLVFGAEQPRPEAYIDTYKDYAMFKLEDKTYAGFCNTTMLQAPTLQELRGCIDIISPQQGQWSP